jgi:hypothetical protein
MSYTNKAAEGWGGDRLVLLERGDERFLELVTVWDTEKDADEFCAGFTDPEDPLLRVAGEGASSIVGAPTRMKAECTKAPDGKTPAVIVRVGSSAKVMDDAEWNQLQVRWTVGTKSTPPLRLK